MMVTPTWMLEGFIGYGPLASPLWLLGMEERCRDDADAATRLAILPTFPLTLGLTTAHRLYGLTDLPNGVAVWEAARELAAACGLKSANVGEQTGDVLLAELLPLPRPMNDDEHWPEAYRSIFADCSRYEAALLARRAARHAELISQHGPRIVVVHGARYHDEVEKALLAVGAERVFRRWATQPWRELDGKTPVDRCIARDLTDLLETDKVYTRLHKRYGGKTPDEILAAVPSAHERIREWVCGVVGKSGAETSAT